MAKTHPDNIASQRVLIKSGARKGELLEGVYSRYLDGGANGDLIGWYFDRPGCSQEDLEEYDRRLKDGTLRGGEGNGVV